MIIRKLRPTLHSITYYLKFSIRCACSSSRTTIGTNLRIDIGEKRRLVQKFLHTSRSMSGVQNIGGYQVHAWSISGLETSVVVRKEDFQVVFDLGTTTREAVKAPLVFFSHGHIDHIAGLPQHVSKRGLYSLKPAKYFAPPHLVEPLKHLTRHVGEIHGEIDSLKDVNIQPIAVGESVKIGSRSAVAFPTQHRVPSQGYVIYKNQRKLKEEYRELSGPEIGQLHKDGVDLYETMVIPEIAYTGDTMFDIFYDPFNPDLLKVKLLIMEATYIDGETDRHGKTSLEKARERGHTHLQELIDNASLFENVENIVLIHFSDKYSTKYIRDTVNKIVPPELRKKIHLALLAKQTLV